MVKSPPHLVTLVLLAGVSALSMNLFLPSLPSIAQGFDTPYALAQLVLSLYLAATAVAQLIISPLSDRYGRRPVLIGAYFVFIGGSIICVFAPTIEILLLGRVLQAAGAAGFAISRAIIRDLYSREKAASMIGYVTMAMTLVPMMGPLAGGYIEEAFGWRGSFILLLVVSFATLMLIYFDLGETNTSKSASLGRQFRSYGLLLQEKTFWGYVAVATACSGVFFAFIGGAPYVAQQLMGLTASEMGAHFIAVAFGYMVGNFLSGRYSEAVGIERMMFYGGAVCTLGVVISLGWFLSGSNSALALFLPMALVGVGNGLTLPNALAGTISVRPELAGSASGITGFIQVAGGAALSIVASANLSPQSGPFPLLYIMLITAVVSMAIASVMLSKSRKSMPAQ